MASRRLHGEVLVRDFHLSPLVVGRALRRQVMLRLQVLEELACNHRFEGGVIERERLFYVRLHRLDPARCGGGPIARCRGLTTACSLHRFRHVASRVRFDGLGPPS